MLFTIVRVEFGRQGGRNGGEWGWGENGTITGNAAMRHDRVTASASARPGARFRPVSAALRRQILAFELQGTSR